MKIVKHFEDFGFFNKHFEGSEPNSPKKDFWRWGLGEDGDLYCQCSEFAFPDKWFRYECATSKVDFDDMRRIVKEFGHLVAFI